MVSPAIGLSHKSEDVMLLIEVLVHGIYSPSLQLLRKSVDNYQPGHTIPSCQVELVWEEEEKCPKRLSHKLPISGVKPFGTYIRISRNPIPPGQT